MHYYKRVNINAVLLFKFSVQTGQILPLAMGGLVLIMILTYQLFDVGQVQNERQIANNVADSAVFSGLTTQAQALNTLAYTNRALIANHVAVGQYVSLSSYIEYIEDVGQSIGTVVSFIPTGVTQVIGRIIHRSATAFGEIRQGIPITIAVTTSVQRSLSLAQSAIIYNTLVEPRLTINRVIALQDSRYSLTALGNVGIAENAYNWFRFTDQYDSNRSNARKANLVRISMDRFSRQRNHRLTFANIGVLEVYLQKEGQTRLVRGRANGRATWTWQARDAGSLWLEQDYGLFDIEIELPLGHAAHSLNHNRSSNRWFSQNRYAELLATAFHQRVRSPLYQLEGSFRDLRHLDNADQDAELTLRLEIGLEQEALRTSQDFLDETIPTSSPFNLNSEPNQQLTAVSSGAVRFDRPYGRQDARQEYANLYNPFWFVRLTDSTSAQRLAWARKLLVRTSPAAITHWNDSQ